MTGGKPCIKDLIVTEGAVLPGVPAAAGISLSHV